MRKNSVALWALLCLLLSTVTIAQDPRLADVDAFVASVMQAGSVPGLALVIVEGDQVLMAKGFGSRRRGEASPVDAHTLFGIASLTKAFTTAALGILVDRGTVRLDEPIAEALPGFQLADPDVRITPRCGMHSHTAPAPPPRTCSGIRTPTPALRHLFPQWPHSLRKPPYGSSSSTTT